MENARIQRQTPSQQWQTVMTCSSDPTTIAKRLDEAKMKFKMPVRAVDRFGRMLDMR